MAGRGKRINISEAQLRKAEGYALDGCKNNTIAKLMGWHEHFIDEHKEILKALSKKRAEGDLEIHRAQRKRLRQGSDTMAIWLGKNRLDQSDKLDSPFAEALPAVLLIGGRPKETTDKV